MHFQITGLDPASFLPLYDLAESELASQFIRRCRADVDSLFPDRIELRDAHPGETLLLLNYLHQPADSPYRASHAIFVREGATLPYVAVDEIPPALQTRTLSLRAFDAGHMIVDADLAAADSIAPTIRRLLEQPEVSYVHAHFAKRGCFAARVDRV